MEEENIIKKLNDLSVQIALSEKSFLEQKNDILMEQLKIVWELYKNAKEGKTNNIPRQPNKPVSPIPEKGGEKNEETEVEEEEQENPNQNNTIETTKLPWV